MNALPPSAHVAAAAINQTVGDWSGNLRRVRAAIAEARRRGVRLLLLPEGCLPGYSLGDRLPRRGTLERSWASLVSLLPYTAGMVVCAGLPVADRGAIYNAMAVLADGRLGGLVAKQLLATGDVEYEERWYQPWPPGRVARYTGPDGLSCPMGQLLFDARGIGRFGIEICEDGWKGLRPGSIQALAGALIVANPSASWFQLGKQAARRRLVQELSRQDHVAYLYASLLGCDATRLVFDGASFVAARGRVLVEGDRFRFDQDHFIADAIVDLDALRLSRREEGSWRRQVAELDAGVHGPVPEVVELPGDYATPAAAPPRPPQWELGGGAEADPSLSWLAREGLISRAPAGPDIPFLELELALATGLRDYMRKSGIRRAVVALSGGRDSAMVALLVHRALRYANPGLAPPEIAALARRTLAAVWLPSAFSSESTAKAARGVAGEIGAELVEIGIQEIVDGSRGLLEEAHGGPLDWSDPLHDLAMQNLQARVRGTMAWGVANLRRALLLTTSNQSEAAVGYTTMDGDTAGGLAPLGGVPKTLVTAWLRWARRFHDYACLDAVLASPPSAELRPPERSQTDEDDLMPFAVLDRLLEHFVQEGQDPAEMLRSLWPEMRQRYHGDRRAFAADVARFVRMFCAAQWKRERLAISFRVTGFDLDPKTGLRFPPVQAAFAQEIAELEAAIEE